MTPRYFLALAGATVIGVAGAVIAVVQETRTAGGAEEVDQLMFPALVERANDVTTVRFRSADAEATITFDGESWIFVERNGYPVPTANVRSVVSGIASLRRFEPKTDDPGKYARLGVEDIGTPEATSREVILETAGGAELAAVILGRISNTMAFDPLGGLYVREPGDPRTWLVRGAVALPPSAAEWMERQIVHVPGPDIQRLVIHEGPEVVLTAAKRQDEGDIIRYHLDPDEEGIRAADSAWKQVASGVVSVNFDDVQPIGELADLEPVRVIEIYTAKGMTLTVSMYMIEEAGWVTFAAVAEPDAEDAERAQNIREITAGWAYQLPAHKIRAMRRDLAELKEPIEEEVPLVPGLPGGVQLPPGFQLGPGGVVPENLPLPRGFNLSPGAVPVPFPPAPQAPPAEAPAAPPAGGGGGGG